MESFKTKYMNEMNPKHMRFFSVFYSVSYTILAVVQLIDRDYFFAGVYLVCAVLMFFVYLPSIFKGMKTKEPDFSGITIDEEKIRISHVVFAGQQEILIKEIRTLQLNRPYNDTFEITMKDGKNVRVPLYSFAKPDQERMKELLKEYLHQR